MVRHAKTHESELQGRKKYKCKSCDKTYTEESNLKRHTNEKHRNIEVRHMTCEFCNKMYPDEWSHKRHIQNVHSVTPDNKCEFCEKTFSRRIIYIKHKYIIISSQWNVIFVTRSLITKTI